VYTFAVLSGLIKFPLPESQFNPRLASDFFLPTLRFLYPNPRLIASSLNNTARDEGGGVIARDFFEKASIPLMFSQVNVLGGRQAVANFKLKLSKLSGDGSRATKGFVNFDKSVLFALNLWSFADSLRALRERCAFQCLKRFIRRHHKLKIEEPNKTAFALVGTTQGKSNAAQIPHAAARIHEAQALDAVLSRSS
jgi:hypothetical protein